MTTEQDPQDQEPVHQAKTPRDPLRNPFTAGPGSLPVFFAGRAPELTQFQALLKKLSAGKHPGNLLIQGWRTSGKSSLLGAFSGLAEAEGAICAHIRLRPQIDIAFGLTRALEAVLQEFDRAAPLGDLLDGLQSSLRHLRMGVLPVRLSYGEVHAPGDFKDGAKDFELLLLAIGKLAQQRNRGVLLFIDDFHRVDRPGFKALAMALAEVQAAKLPVAVVTAGLPPVPRALSPGRAVVDEVFEIGELSALATEAVEAILTQRVDGAGLLFEPEALALAVSWSDGWALRAQHLGAQLWNLPTPRASAQDVQEAIAKAATRIDHTVYEPALEDLSPKEARLVAGVIGHSKNLVGWDDLHAIGQRVFEASPQAVLPRLLDKEVLLRDEAFTTFGFVIPHWKEFLHDHFETETALAQHTQGAQHV